MFWWKTLTLEVFRHRTAPTQEVVRWKLDINLFVGYVSFGVVLAAMTAHAPPPTRTAKAIGCLKERKYTLDFGRAIYELQRVVTHCPCYTLSRSPLVACKTPVGSDDEGALVMEWELMLGDEDDGAEVENRKTTKPSESPSRNKDLLRRQQYLQYEIEQVEKVLQMLQVGVEPLPNEDRQAAVQGKEAAKPSPNAQSHTRTSSPQAVGRDGLDTTKEAKKHPRVTCKGKTANR